MRLIGCKARRKIDNHYDGQTKTPLRREAIDLVRLAAPWGIPVLYRPKSGIESDVWKDRQTYWFTV
jgi:hypothetical protein